MSWWIYIKKSNFSGKSEEVRAESKNCHSFRKIIQLKTINSLWLFWKGQLIWRYFIFLKNSSNYNLFSENGGIKFCLKHQKKIEFAASFPNTLILCYVPKLTNDTQKFINKNEYFYVELINKQLLIHLKTILNRRTTKKYGLDISIIWIAQKSPPGTVTVKNNFSAWSRFGKMAMNHHKKVVNLINQPAQRPFFDLRMRCCRRCASACAPCKFYQSTL